MNLEELIALVREEAHKDRHRQGESTLLQLAALELAAEVEKMIQDMTSTPNIEEDKL